MKIEDRKSKTGSRKTKASKSENKTMDRKIEIENIETGE